MIRKSTLYTILTGAFVICSCQAIEEKDTILPEGERYPMTMHGGCEAGPAVRTTLAPDGVTLQWEEEESVAILDKNCKTSGSAYIFEKTSQEGSTATFEGEVGAPADVYFAAYPISINPCIFSASLGKLKFDFPEPQKLVAGNIAPGTNIAFTRVGDDGSFILHNLCGYLKFTLTEDNIKSIRIKGNAEETLCGKFTAQVGTDGIPVATSTSAVKEMTLQPLSGSCFTPGDYYVQMLPGTYSKGLSFTGINTKDEEMLQLSPKSIEVKRSTIHDIGTLAFTNPDERCRKITFPAFADLNQGESAINDHEGGMERSRLVQEYRSYTEIPCGTGTQVSAISAGRYPTYVRVEKAACGDWIVLFNPPSGSGSSYSLPGNTNVIARSKDLRSIYASEVLNTAVSYNSIKGNTNKRVYSGAYGLGLANGDFIIVSAYRPVNSYKSIPEENGLWIRRSTDGGKTFPTDAAHSKPIFTGNICWEPQLLQLPDGTVQCYFTLDEYSYETDSPEKVGSGFGLIESKDNGITWSDMKCVVRQWSNNNSGGGRFTEQMPAVVLLNSTDGTMTFGAAAEDHVEGYTTGSETFGISFFRSNSDGTWDSIPLDGHSTGPAQAWRHCWSGGAPSMIQFPSGELVVTYSTGGYRMSRTANVTSWETGEHCAYRFISGLTWGSITKLSSHTLLHAGNYFFPQADGTRPGGLIFVQSALNHNITATSRTVKVDGLTDDWAVTDEALMLGGQSQAEAFIRCSRDDRYAYFLLEVPDDDLMREGASTDDRVGIYLASPTDDVDASAVRVTASFDGLLSASRFDPSRGWVEADGLGVEVAATYDGWINRRGTPDNGYVVEIAIPLAAVPASDGKILFNACLYDKVDGSGPRYDFLSGEEEAAPGRTSTRRWFYIKGF